MCSDGRCYRHGDIYCVQCFFTLLLKSSPTSALRSTDVTPEDIMRRQEEASNNNIWPLHKLEYEIRKSTLGSPKTALVDILFRCFISRGCRWFGWRQCLWLVLFYTLLTFYPEWCVDTPKRNWFGWVGEVFVCYPKRAYLPYAQTTINSECVDIN